MRVTIVRVAMLTLLGTSPGLVTPSGASGGLDDALYLVFEISPDGSARPVFSAPVELRAPRGGRRPRAFAHPTRSHTVVSVQLHDDAGALVFEETQQLPRWLRSESPGAVLGDGTFAIESHPVSEPVTAFAVRIPIVPDARLSLHSELMRRPMDFRLDDLTSGARSARPSIPAAIPLVQSGDPGNRLDLLILGEGYTSAQRSQFDTDVASLMNGFFDITPLQEYRNYINVSTLFVPSNEPGADQPGYDAACAEFTRAQSCCGDATAFGMTPVNVDTAFDATFCSFNTQRALTVDFAKVLAAAAAEPNWDMIIVIVNSSTYGATGGGITVVSTNDFQTDVVEHELGHSFALLADEYEDPDPSYPDCSDVDPALAPCEPNVTDQTSRALVKWQRWIKAMQPIPSFDPPPIATAAGLWPGARYMSAGKYRQGYSCLMRFLGSPFCDVAAEAFAIRFYQGGWGTPENGIDNVEPGSESPPPGPVNLPEVGGTFSVTVAGPQSGPDLRTDWYVDAILATSASVQSGDRASHSLTTTPGTHTVELRVTDMSPIIHETIRGTLMSTRVWNVTVGPTGSAICSDADGSGSVTVTDGVQTLRAAAELSSVCVPTRCDLDGNGTISVTDGVNVLRAAAGLPFPANCPR